MSFQDLGSLEKNGGSGAPMPLRRPRSNPRSSSLSNITPMKKNGSESSTASMSTGSAYGEEDPISTAGAGGTARRGSSNVSGSLSGTVSSLSGSIATYQKLVSDYEVLFRSNSRAYTHERKSKALLDDIRQLESEISRQLNALDAAIGGRSGPFDGGDELARVKVSHSKLARDFDRIKASYDGTMRRRSSSSGYGGGVGSSGDAGGGTWARDEAPLGSAAAHGNDQQVQMVMQREEEYSKQAMQSREEDIQQINQKMNKVNEIYKDLGNLVSSQQDQIDEIEDAVADSNQNAESGLDQLERANRPWFGGRGGGGKDNKNGDGDGDGEAAAGGDGNGEASAEEKSWGDAWTESYAEFQRDMNEIGNDIVAKGRHLQLCFCGAFGGAVVDSTLS